MSVGEKIRHLRVMEKCWSMEALSRVLGCNLRTVENWETGLTLPSLERFVKLLKAFDITYDEFMKEVEI